ncbi:MAG: DUF58 domain-containing protein [Gammaproteobacteria bacterium]|nr:MAG: DUF58 domain-containing protein [Gammaproteobacteria bacterium]
MRLSKNWAGAWMRRWIRRRQGPDRGPVCLHRSRIYILPTGLGLAFAAMLLAMLLGALNYGNNLGLGLVFLLAALALVAMQACHRNLESVTVSEAGTEPPFAGGEAIFRVTLTNPSNAARHDLALATPALEEAPVSLPATGEAIVALRLPARRRGLVRLDRIEIATRHPFGLFRAWAVVHPQLHCLVYPRPVDRAPFPPPTPGGAAGGRASRGVEDFAGLKDYHPGDPPRHIAWKAHARGGELLVKEFSGTTAPEPVFDLDATTGADLEERLATIARWILDADAAGQVFGLRLPGLEIPPQPGPRQRQRCLAALAGFEAPVTVDA